MTLTCTKPDTDDDSDNPPVTEGYKWYHGDDDLAGTSNQYTITTKHRDQAGDYSCKYTSGSNVLSVKSESVNVKYLCKFIIILQARFTAVVRTKY